MYTHVAFIYAYVFRRRASLQHKTVTVYTTKVVYSVKTVKSVFHYDQDKTFSPREYLTPRIIAYPVMSASKSFVTGITLDR